MTEVYWLEQTEADLPQDDAWLNPAEMQRLNELRFAKRRDDWRLGRWTAKRAVASCLGLAEHPPALATIEIRAAASGVPEVFLASGQGPVSISLSHSSGRSVCAIAHGIVAIGCDVEKVEPRGDAFVVDYFTDDEQALVAQSSRADRDCLLALLWSAKESALKALHEGLRLDTRSAVVRPVNFDSGLKDWQSIEVRTDDSQVFHGWWRPAGSFVWTMVSAPPRNRPISLQLSSTQATTPPLG